MRWPWVSAARLDAERAYQEHRFALLQEQTEFRILAANASIDWLQRQNAQLTDQLVRIQRRQAGLHEVPKEPKPALEPMPRALREYIAGFANRSIQKAQRDAAYKRHSQGEPWSSIAADLMEDDQPEEGDD